MGNQRGQKGGGGQHFAHFFSLPPTFSFFVPLSGDLLVSFFGGVLVGRDPQMCLFSPSGCLVEAPGGLQWPNKVVAIFFATNS